MTKLDLNKPVQTRDGRKVRIICTDKKGDFPLVALIPQTNNNEEVCTYSLDGYYYKNEAQCDRDLINVPEQKEKWMNMYPYDTGCSYYYLYNSLEEADKMASPDRLGVFHITYRYGKIIKTEYNKVL